MIEKNSRADRVRKEEELHRVHEYRNILHTINKREAKWIGHILHRNWLIRNVIEGDI